MVRAYGLPVNGSEGQGRRYVAKPVLWEVDMVTAICATGKMVTITMAVKMLKI